MKRAKGKDSEEQSAGKSLSKAETAAMVPMFEDMKTWLEKVVDVEIEKKTSATINSSNNNRAEQMIRKWGINYNNSLFCITTAMADASALFFSLIKSCRNLSVNPTVYLAHLFFNCNRIKNGDKETWIAMLPGKCSLDDVIELKNKIAGTKPLDGRSEPYML